MADIMTFPETIEEYMEQYKITDTEQIYTNGTELVPIFRIKQWFEHLPSAEPEIIRCKNCKYYDGRPCGNVDWYNTDSDYCSRAEGRTDE